MSRVNSKTKLGGRQKSRADKKGSGVEAEVKKPEIPQLAWKIVSESASKTLRDLKDVDAIAKKLADILSLTATQECLKNAAQLDYFVAGYCLKHAVKEWNFTNEQASAFITILDIMLKNIKNKGLSLGENLKELQALLAGVGVPNAPTPLECFTSETGSTVLQYLQTTLFQHYHLFQCLVTEEQEEETHTLQLKVELPNVEETLFPPPLEEGIPLELYERCVCARPDTGTKEPQEQEGASAQELHEGVPEGSDVTDGPTEEELEVSAEDLTALIESMAQTTLQTFQSQMLQKIKEKEDSMNSRLSKLEKALNVQSTDSRKTSDAH